MKKKRWWFILIITFLFLTGCSSGAALKYSLSGTKPNNFYYTDTMIKDMKSNGISSILVLETNLQKENNLKDDDIQILKNFFNSIKTKNFLSSRPDIPEKPQFRFYIVSGADKYVINVYNEKYIGIFPWDGAYSMDYIDMTDVKTLYNLYNLCKYLYRD